MNADQVNNELRTMKAELLHSLEHVHLMLVFQTFPYTTHRYKQAALCQSIPECTRRTIRPS